MADKLIIFDTTLRDGEQSPGASMTKDEKLRIARQLERHEGRRDRGRFCRLLERRLRSGEGDRPCRSKTAPCARWRAPTTATSRAPPRP